MKNDFLARMDGKDIEMLVDSGVIPKVMIRRYLICRYIWDQVMTGREGATEEAVEAMMAKYGMCKSGVKRIYYDYRKFRE